MSSFPYIIKDKNNSTPIKINSNTINQSNTLKQYSLEKVLFDPTKSSPPNNFMIKLHKRLTVYNAYHKNVEMFEIVEIE